MHNVKGTQGIEMNSSMALKKTLLSKANFYFLFILKIMT